MRGRGGVSEEGCASANGPLGSRALGEGSGRSHDQVIVVGADALHFHCSPGRNVV